MKVAALKHDLTKKNMRAFCISVDWLEWWEEFYLSVESDGRPKYKTINKFVVAKANLGKYNATQKTFLRWYLGPPGDNEALDKEYSWTKPQDWLHKRETGGWFTKSSLDAATKEIRSRIHSLDALKEVGNGPLLRMVARVDGLAAKLDETFKGELFVPGKSEAENLARARTYFELHQQLLGMSERTFALYARAHGIDFSNIEGFALLQAASTAAQREQVQATNRMTQAMNDIVSMALMKSSKFGTPLPPQVTQRLIEAKNEEVVQPVVPSKKDKPH